MTLCKPAPEEQARAIGFFEGLLAAPEVQSLLNLYFDPTSERLLRRFAGATFDLIGRERRDSPDEVTVGDLLAVSLLDTPFDAGAVRDLLDEGPIRERVRLGLLDLPPHIDLARADDAVLLVAENLFEVLDEIPDVGSTRASKFLARKRPHLIPIWDSTVDRLLRPGRDEHWLLMQAVMGAPSVVSLVSRARNGIRASVRQRLHHVLGGSIEELPTGLRLLDAALWLVGSSADPVKAARKEAGLSEDQRNALLRS